MIQILIIADDFTGALDTGVQFASAGFRTVVRTSEKDSFAQRTEDDVQVLVIDVETRHLSPEKAYEIVFEVTRQAVSAGVPHIYKKTDSALRGNIGSELAAVLEASPSKVLPFIPALPHMNRLTWKGTQYIDGEPVAESVFGKDPFEPVKYSYIPDIIRQQTDMRTVVIREDEEEGTNSRTEDGKKEIHIYDVTSQKRLRQVAGRLIHGERLQVMAGCAGFSSVLSELLKVEEHNGCCDFLTSGIVMVNGSLNPITAGQLDHAQNSCGVRRIFLTPIQKLEKSYWQTQKGQTEGQLILQKCREYEFFIIDGKDPDGSGMTNEYAGKLGMDLEEVRHQITVSLGQLVKYLMENNLHHTLMIIGGDTLWGVLKELEICEMCPLEEIFPGTVLSSFNFQGQEYQLISKSGGFGQKSLIEDILEMCKDRKERVIC